MKTTRSPSLTALRAFEASARLGNFAKAADELHVTPAAISHRIKELEASLDVRLFERKARGVALTEPGQRYWQRIAGAFEVIDRATAELGETTLDGPLKISTPQSFAENWLVPRLPAFCRRYPGLTLTVEGGSRLADLKSEQAQVALRFGAGRYPGLTAEWLLGDCLSVLASPVLLASSAGIPLVDLMASSTLLNDGTIAANEPWSTWTPWLRDAGLHADTPLRRMHLSDSGLTINACSQSAGLCIGRMSLAFERLRRGELVALLPWRPADYAYYLVCRPRDEHNPRILAFGTWLRDEIDRYVAEIGQTFNLTLARPGAAETD